MMVHILMFLSAVGVGASLTLLRGGLDVTVLIAGAGMAVLGAWFAPNFTKYP